jgi:hypothetical protein
MDRAELGDWVRSGLGESSGHGNSEQKQRRAKWMESSRAQEAGNNRATNRGARGARDPEIQGAGRVQGDMRAQENSRRGDQGARPGEQQGARRARDGRARRAALGSSAQRAEQEDEKRLRAGLNPSWSTATSAGARQTEPSRIQARREPPWTGAEMAERHRSRDGPELGLGHDASNREAEAMGGDSAGSLAGRI